jgi:DNA ligase-1
MKNPKLFSCIFSISIFLRTFATPLFPLLASETQKPQIQLANLYHQGFDVTKYLVSEKLDGVHAYFDGEKLISREGNIYNAPQWFIKNFPHEHLEGELWIGRGKFEELSAIVRKEIPDENWKSVRLMLFDMPRHGGVFAQRYEAMKIAVAQTNSAYLQVIEQSKISSHEELTKRLHAMVKNGAEGLMLHRADALYQAVRNDDLLKLKTFEDAEAMVIAHIPGQGKFSGMMGALLVENAEKIRFKIGGGFSDAQRKSPPQIGSVITYKFYGKTKNNKPRFASFMRVRDVQ